MAGYKIGSKAWLDFIKDQIITAADLLKYPEGLSDGEIEKICVKHDDLVWKLCDYIEKNCLDKNH